MIRSFNDIISRGATVADPGFPREGGASTFEFGRKPITRQGFRQKLQENERN